VQFNAHRRSTKKFWLQERMEASQNRIDLARTEQVRILTRLTDAVIFEEFRPKEVLGREEFLSRRLREPDPAPSISRSSAAPSTDSWRSSSAWRTEAGSTSSPTSGQEPRDIFREFADSIRSSTRPRADVKYHSGTRTSSRRPRAAKVHLSLCFNPSHLEFVNPGRAGSDAREQDRYGDERHETGMALLIHGDAAFAGGGHHQETLNLSELRGYTTGGTLHVVVNNQIGFTTNPEDAALFGLTRPTSRRCSRSRSST